MSIYETNIFITETEYNNLFPIYIESSININNILLFEKINKSYLMFNNNNNNKIMKLRKE
jgi:hypothetical protein